MIAINFTFGGKKPVLDESNPFYPILVIMRLNYKDRRVNQYLVADFLWVPYTQPFH